MSDNAKPAPKALHTLTNATGAIHGLGVSDGSTVEFAPGASLDLELTDAEAAEIEALGWFTVAAVKPAKPAKAADAA